MKNNILNILWQHKYFWWAYIYYVISKIVFFPDGRIWKKRHEDRSHHSNKNKTKQKEEKMRDKSMYTHSCLIYMKKKKKQKPLECSQAWRWTFLTGPFLYDYSVKIADSDITLDFTPPRQYLTHIYTKQKELTSTFRWHKIIFFSAVKMIKQASVTCIGGLSDSWLGFFFCHMLEFNLLQIFVLC